MVATAVFEVALLATAASYAVYAVTYAAAVEVLRPAAVVDAVAAVPYVALRAVTNVSYLPLSVSISALAAVYEVDSCN